LGVLPFANSQKKAYQLVWSDEFNNNGQPDSTVWQFEHGFVRNHEAQWYQPQNAYCKNGKLMIEAKKAHRKNPHYKLGNKSWKANREWINYTSASLNTRGHKTWKYGRFVMRAKIDTSLGLWPAFWTLGVKGQWPSSGEIDIMEFYRHHLLANIACGTQTQNVAKWYSNKRAINFFKQKNWSKHFHIWRMDWTAQKISLYVDDFLMNSIPVDSLVNANGVNPFRQPQYILLNLALGGDNGGDLSQTPFPSKYEIDYVRVYQKK
jgi:beta-glucanase (GH16 family)